MKKILLQAFLMMVAGISFSQTTDLGLPESIRGKFGKPKKYHALPAVDADAQIALDDQDRINGIDKVFRFGFEHAVSVDILAAAEKKTLPNGDVLYQYGVICPGAISINVIFDHFKLAAGTRLYLASDNGETFAGAYTSINNSPAAMLGTELVYDQKAVIEVIEPKAVAGQSTVHLGTVVHGYRDLDGFMEKALGQAGACNIDVNCPLGLGWENQRNAVACVVSGGGACSGSLVNNTSGAIIPYYLTANHCGTAGTGGWVFRFRWERTAANAICATTNSTANNGPVNMTVNGCVLRANNSSSDFILVELNTAPDPAWGIYYNGWDHSDALTVTQGTGIHHPSGDIKKISRENDPLTQQVTAFNGNPNTNVWRVANWDQGVTEPGSSGSPIFDQNHRTIGVLSGGTSACSGTVDNGGYDIYGRFGTAWDLGATPATRLKEWLDPGNTNIPFIDGVDPAGTILQVDAGIQTPQGVSGNICGATVTPQLTIFNAGTSTLTSATITYSFDGGNAMIYNWSGSLAQYESSVITLPNQTLTGGNHTFTATITAANGAADLGTLNNTISTVLNVVVNGEIIDLNLNLDYWASETAWQVLDQSNNVLYSGGNYSNGTSGQVTPVNVEFCLSAGCYKFRITDTQGDGMTSDDDPPGSYTITSGNGTILAQLTAEEANFGSSDIRPFCVTGTNGVEEYLLNKSISVFPNPADDVLKLSVSGDNQLQSVEVLNVAGQLLISAGAQSNAAELNVADLSQGIYLVKVHTSLGTIVRQIAIR